MADGKKTGLHVYLATSPNGHKLAVALEELGLPYTVHKIDLSKGEQKQEAFLHLNPAGRIPVLVDYDAKPGEGFVLAESGACLFYLAAEKAKSDELLPPDPAGRAEALSWVFFQTGHLAGPTFTVVTGLLMGMSYSAEAMQAAVKAVHDAFKILEGRLERSGDWLAAGRFTIADVAFVSSVIFCKELLGIDLQATYPRLAAWLDRALARPAVRKGLNVPEPNPCLGEGRPANQLVQAATDRLAKLGLHFGSA